MTYFDFPADRPLPLWKRSAAATAVAGLHLLALLVAFGLAVRPELTQLPQALTVRMVQAAALPQPQPKPVEAVAAPIPPPAVRPRKALMAPPAVLTAAPSATTASSFTVAPQAEPRVVEAEPAAPVPAPFAAARFDADYLHNPKPAYPDMSRRLGEEGKVVLAVRVSARGTALSVEIRLSSGFMRLDEAARAAVEKWRFVPARQGSEAIESSVLVPLRFSLDN